MTALDQADLWLLQNDPELTGKSAEYLLNKKIRDTHCLGAEFLDETELTDNREESQGHEAHEAFFEFVGKQNWLNREAKILVLGIAQDQSLARIGQEFGGISKQAVYKRLHKHRSAIQYLIKIWNGNDNPTLKAEVEAKPIPYFVEKNQQLAFDFFGGAQ